MKKTLILATVIAALAGIWTVAVMNIKSFGDVPFILWPTFVAWGAFFYAGATVDGLIKGLVQFASGVAFAAIAAYVWLHVGTLAADDTNFIYLGILVFVLAWPITALSGAPALKGYWAAVPAGFMGAGVFFGVFFFGNSAVAAGGASASEFNSAIAAFLPLLCGGLLGWLSMAITNVLAAEPEPVAAPHAV